MDPEFPTPRVMRYHPPPKRKAELPMLDMSPLLWDLVQENSPVARAYDESDHEVQKMHWKDDHNICNLVRRMKKFQREMIDTEEKWFTQLQTPFHSQRISELDVLSTALLGVTPAPPSSGEPDSSHNVASSSGLDVPTLLSIGILDRVSDDISLTVQLLLHRLQAQQSSSDADGAGLQYLADRLRKAVAHSDFRRIKRILAPLVQNDNGRMLITDCLPDIVSAVAKDGQPSPAASRFLKDLQFNLERQKFSNDDLVVPESPPQG